MALSITLDTRSLTAFRILLGFYLVYDIYSRLALGKYDMAWYIDDHDNHNNNSYHHAYLETNDTPHHAPLHQIWFYRGSARLQYALFALTLLWIASVLILGMGQAQSSSSTAALSKLPLYLLVTSYQSRNMWSHDGSDLIVRHLLVWACFLPLSITTTTSNNISSKTTVATFATGALATQLLLVYWGTICCRVLDRPSPSQWLAPDWSAVHYALSGSFATRGITHLVTNSHPWVSQILTATAMVVETVVPGMLWWSSCSFTTRQQQPIWSRIRTVCTFLMISFHAGLLCAMNLPHWQGIGMVMQVIWLPSQFWDYWLPSAASMGRRDDTHSDGMSKPPSLPPVTRANLVSRALQYFLFVYMLHNFAGRREWIIKHDNGDIGEALRLNQEWAMFAQVATTAHNTFVTGTIVVPTSSSGSSSSGHNETASTTLAVDLFRYIQLSPSHPNITTCCPQVGLKENDPYPQDMSRRYPSPRWERAVHHWGRDYYHLMNVKQLKEHQRRVKHFLQALCHLVQQDLLTPQQYGKNIAQDSNVQLQTIEFRTLHLKLMPPGSPLRYAQHRIHPDSVTQVDCMPTLSPVLSTAKDEL